MRLTSPDPSDLVMGNEAVDDRASFARCGRRRRIGASSETSGSSIARRPLLRDGSRPTAIRRRRQTRFATIDSVSALAPAAMSMASPVGPAIAHSHRFLTIVCA
jgi:hypothetical protein